MMKSFITGASLLLLSIGSSAVMAVPITGDISFAGTSFVTGTTLNFNNPILVITADGTFADEGIALGSTATFNPLDYSSPFAGVTPLWTIGGFSFDLETVEVGPTGTNLPLTLSGTGTLMNASYDNTLYNWAYSGNGNNINSTLTFSAFSAPTPVPEPGSLALLGLGLVGFAVTGYKRRRTQS